jgi:hypothetical protein
LLAVERNSDFAVRSKCLPCATGRVWASFAVPKATTPSEVRIPPYGVHAGGIAFAGILEECQPYSRRDAGEGKVRAERKQQPG